VLVTVLRTAVSKLNQVIVWLRQLEAHQRVKEALYLQVQLQCVMRFLLCLL